MFLSTVYLYIYINRNINLNILKKTNNQRYSNFNIL